MLLRAPEGMEVCRRAWARVTVGQACHLSSLPGCGGAAARGAATGDVGRRELDGLYEGATLHSTLPFYVNVVLHVGILHVNENQ